MILNRLMKKGFRKVLKISKISAIVSLIAVFGFSNFISFLPQVWQNNELAESLKIKEAQAAVNTEVVDLYRGGKLTHSELYCADGFHPSDAGYEKWAKFFEESMAYW